MNDQPQIDEKASPQSLGRLFIRALISGGLLFVLLSIAGVLIAGGILLTTGYDEAIEKIFEVLEQAAGWALLAASIPILGVAAVLAVDLLKTAWLSVKTVTAPLRKQG